MLKGVIFLMGIQSLFGTLQEKGIIEGSIRINYNNIQKSIISALSSDEVMNVVKKLDESHVGEYLSPPEVQAEEYQGYRIRRNEISMHDTYEAKPKNVEYRDSKLIRYANSVQSENQYDMKNLKNRTIRCYKHIVQNGETIEDLASMYGVPWEVIMRLNRMYDAEDLHTGQNVIIPSRMA